MAPCSRLVIGKCSLLQAASDAPNLLLQRAEQPGLRCGFAPSARCSIPSSVAFRCFRRLVNDVIFITSRS